VDQVRVFRSLELARGRLYSLVAPQPEKSQFDAEVIDSERNVYLQLRGYRTVALPAGVDADVLKKLQALFAPRTAAA